MDLVRLVRATCRKVSPASDGMTATGRAQTHLAQGDCCDCPDHKHVLAARLAAGDLELRALASSVSAGY